MSMLPVPDTTAAMQQVQAHRLGQMARMGKDGAANMKKIEQTAKEFEAVFLAEMVKPMFEGIETDGMFGGGKGEEVFRGMMVDEYGRMLARTGQLGIADFLKAEMIRMQGEDPNSIPAAEVTALAEINKNQTNGVMNEQ